MLREPDPRDRTLSAAEEARLIEAAAGHLKAPIEFSLLTGVRLGNAINLDWSQVDLRSREITFRVKPRKPGGKVHVLPITNESLVLVSNQGPKEAGRVFTYKGHLIKSWRTAWEAAKRRAGLDDFRWHDLRHTAGTRMVQRGGDISIVQEVLGHADIATTRRYVHHATADKRRAMELLSRNSSEPAHENAASC